MSRVRVILAALLLACIGEGTSGPGENVNVTGVWAGPVRIALDTDTMSAPLTLRLHQSPNTGELTGSLDFTPLGESRPITGEVKNREVTVLAASEESPEGDCHRFTLRWVFTARSAELRLTRLSGQICEPDSLGGHAALRTITGASGTIVLQ